MRGIWEEVTARPEGGKGGTMGELGGQPVQRPWGSTGPRVLEEQQGKPCGWSRVSEGERRRRGGQGEDKGFWPQGGGTPEGYGQRKGQGLIQGPNGAPWWPTARMTDRVAGAEVKQTVSPNPEALQKKKKNVSNQVLFWGNSLGVK